MISRIAVFRSVVLVGDGRRGARRRRQGELVGRRRARHHLGAERRGEVGGGQADAAAGTEHGDPLARGDGRTPGERVQHRGVALHEPGGLARGDRVRDRHDRRRRHDDLRRVAAGRRESEHALADGQPGDAVPDRGDPPGDLGARRVRQRRRELVAALHDQAVDEVDAGRLDVDDDLPGRRLEVGRLDHDEVGERSERVRDEPAHRPDPTDAHPSTRCRSEYRVRARPAPRTRMTPSVAPGARLAGMSPVPPPLPYDDALRERIRTNLAGHDRRVLALDERRHAAVAVVVVDSTVGEDRVDPHEPEPGSMDRIPGGAQGLDGRMFDVSGGAAFLLCRRAAGLNAPRVAVGAARRTARRRRDPRRGGAARDRRGGRCRARRRRRARHDGRLRHALRLRHHAGRAVGRWTDGAATPSRRGAGRATGSACTSCCATTRRASSTSPRATGPSSSCRSVATSIHAPTAAVLVQFRWLALEGRGDPVADFEQPVFAWK